MGKCQINTHKVGPVQVELGVAIHGNVGLGLARQGYAILKIHMAGRCQAWRNKSGCSKARNTIVLYLARLGRVGQGKVWRVLAKHVKTRQGINKKEI